MRILVVSQYFWPEPFIINDLVSVLESQGHEIRVLTGKPNYPDGNLYDGYQQHGVQQEVYSNNVIVHRVPLKPRGVADSARLALNYFSFIWSGLRYFPGLVKGMQFDSILVFAPSPITSALPAILLKRLKRAHLAIWVQDLWPESLSATGHIQKSWLLNLMGRIVKLIYRCSDTLLIQSQAFMSPMLQLTQADKIVYYPNSMLSVPARAEISCPLPPELVELLESKFCVVFAGNIGKAQAMEAVLDAVRCLKTEDIVVVLVGSGSMLNWVEEQKVKYSLHNLILAGRYPMLIMPEIYKRASALLVTLKHDLILSYTIPSKIQAYLAAGKPIIASLDGEGARIVEEAEAGLTCPAEDGKELAARILQMYEASPMTRKQMGDNGYRYFMNNFEMAKQAENLVKILQFRISQQEQGQ